MAANAAHLQRIEAGIGFEWESLPPYVERTSDCVISDERLRLSRVGKSHRGISSCAGVRELWARFVNAEFLEEICELGELTFLYLDRVSVTDLSSIKRLRKLRRIFVRDATKITDLRWLESLSSVQALGLEHLPQVRDLGPLSTLVGLTGLAFEGSMWTPGRVATLAPLSCLAELQCLCIANVRVSDGSLDPLHHLESLQVLQSANYFSGEEFTRLHAARPTLKCQWFQVTADDA